jgi:hypothetical protein
MVNEDTLHSPADYLIGFIKKIVLGYGSLTPFAHHNVFMTGEIILCLSLRRSKNGYDHKNEDQQHFKIKIPAMNF